MRDLSTHSGKLERYLGAEEVRRMSEAMANWYGPPIAVAGVPGKVFAHRGGDFRGRIATGGFASALCVAESFTRRMGRAFRRTARRQGAQANMPGFSSLSDLISEATVANKKQTFTFNRTGPTGVVGVTSSLHKLGPQPAAGAAAAAAPGGTPSTSATLGAMPFNNPAVGGDTSHFVGAQVLASVAPSTLLLYDRLFAVAKTMNSTATEAVTGVPTRYQNTTPGTVDSAEGNFLFVEVGLTALAATAHNWTACNYQDQGNAAGVLPSLTGNSGAIVHRLDHPVNQWFAPLATGDTGIRNLTQMQCSALVATGLIDFVIGHPIAWFPCFVANTACLVDGINTAFNLVRIFDSACLNLLEITKPATTATNYSGTIDYCAG
jgi:hypothetical protein